MRWVTRRSAHVDRTSCPWLIRRFIDPAAEFVFVAADTDPTAIAGRTFDMRGAEFSHEGQHCTFEVMVDRFDLGSDPALVEMGRIIRDADVPPSRTRRAEGPGWTRSSGDSSSARLTTTRSCASPPPSMTPSMPTAKRRQRRNRLRAARRGQPCATPGASPSTWKPRTSNAQQQEAADAGIEEGAIRLPTQRREERLRRRRVGARAGVAVMNRKGKDHHAVGDASQAES